MIWTVGITNIDVIASGLNTWPNKGCLTRVDSVQPKPGGVALNSAITIAKIGGIDCGLIAAIGEDWAGDYLRSVLNTLGIITSNIIKVNTKPTGICLVFLHSDAERSFICGESANDELSYKLVSKKGIKPADIVHIGGALDTASLQGELLKRLLMKFRKTGAMISVDTSWDYSGLWWSNLAPSLPLIDIFFTNEIEAVCLTNSDDPGISANRISDLGPKIVVIKLGERGVYLNCPEYRGIVKGFKVEAIDTTGAGDAFAGGFIYGISKGWNKLQSATFANAVGAMCVSTLGATDGIRSYAEIIHLIYDQNRHEDWIW